MLPPAGPGSLCSAATLLFSAITVHYLVLLLLSSFSCLSFGSCSSSACCFMSVNRGFYFLPSSQVTCSSSSLWATIDILPAQIRDESSASPLSAPLGLAKAFGINYMMEMCWFSHRELNNFIATCDRSQTVCEKRQLFKIFPHFKT